LNDAQQLLDLAFRSALGGKPCAAHFNNQPVIVQARKLRDGFLADFRAGPQVPLWQPGGYKGPAAAPAPDLKEFSCNQNTQRAAHGGAADADQPREVALG